MRFDWDINKDKSNRLKHGVSLYKAQFAFMDIHRVIAFDTKHSTDEEKRYFCFGKVDGKILTVRFIVRGNTIRIFGAGYWRQGRKKYEEENKA